MSTGFGGAETKSIGGKTKEIEMSKPNDGPEAFHKEVEKRMNRLKAPKFKVGEIIDVYDGWRCKVTGYDEKTGKYEVSGIYIDADHENNMSVRKGVAESEIQKARPIQYYKDKMDKARERR